MLGARNLLYEGNEADLGVPFQHLTALQWADRGHADGHKVCVQLLEDAIVDASEESKAELESLAGKLNPASAVR